MAAATPAAPPTDLSGVCFRNQWFLGAVGGFLSPANVFDYFAGSPFFDPNCNNEQLRRKGMHPLDMSQLKTMVGWEYALHEAQEPLLYVLKKQRRDSPDRTTVSTLYYVLDGSVYQAPTAHAIITARMGRSLHNLNLAFSGFRSLLHDKPASPAVTSTDAPAATVDASQTSRVDIILRSALQRLPPTPIPKLLQPAPVPAPATAPAPAAAQDPAPAPPAAPPGAKEAPSPPQDPKAKASEGQGAPKSASVKRAAEASKARQPQSPSQGPPKRPKR